MRDLKWELGDRTWTATTPGGLVYAVEQSPGESGSWWPQVYTEPVQVLGGPMGLNAAKERCQLHRDSELVWREPASGEWWAVSPVLDAEDYCCIAEHDDEPTQWIPAHLSVPIGDPTTLELAKQACQEHHREIVLGRDGEAADGEPLTWKRRTALDDHGQQITEHVAGDPKGVHYRAGRRYGSQLWRVTFTDAAGRSRELPGKHRRLKAARAACQAHADAGRAGNG